MRTEYSVQQTAYSKQRTANSVQQTEKMKTQHKHNRRHTVTATVATTHRQHSLLRITGHTPAAVSQNNSPVFSCCLSTFLLLPPQCTSLARLGVSYIDLYLLHRDDLTKSVSEIVDMMHEFQFRGCYSAWGVSNWDLARLQVHCTAFHCARLSASQPSHASGPECLCRRPSCMLTVLAKPVQSATRHR